MSDNAFDPISTLQAQLAAVTAKLDQISSHSNSNSPSNAYLVARDPAFEITPDDEILSVYPSMDAKGFFKPKHSDTKTAAEYTIELTKEMQSFPKNTTQSYTAPKSSAVAWPESAKHQASFDKQISRYQTQLANLTRPLDAFATEIFTKDMDPEVAQACLEFAETMREHIAHMASGMSKDRADLVYQAHGCNTSKDTDDLIVSNNDIIEASKLSKSLSRATYNRKKIFETF